MRNVIELGDIVELTRDIKMGYHTFKKGDIVRVINYAAGRGYGYIDKDGNTVCEAGMDCILIKKGDKSTFTIKVVNEYWQELVWNETKN
ncbi:MAG: hypothetical protein RSE41_01145 [Clostridia bacterium]